MPKVTVTDNRGLVQAEGSGGLTLASGLILGTETLTEDGDAASTTIPVTILNHNGNEAVTLANGSTVGQIKIFVSTTDNTVTNTLALGGDSATIATTETGSTYVLMWTNAGWQTISRCSSDNANATAVAAMPVFAG